MRLETFTRYIVVATLSTLFDVFLLPQELGLPSLPFLYSTRINHHPRLGKHKQLKSDYKFRDPLNVSLVTDIVPSPLALSTARLKPSTVLIKDSLFLFCPLHCIKVYVFARQRFCS